MEKTAKRLPVIEFLKNVLVLKKHSSPSDAFIKAFTTSLFQQKNYG